MQSRESYHSYIGYALVVSFFVCIISVLLIANMLFGQGSSLSDLDVDAVLLGIVLLVLVLTFCILERCNDINNPFSAMRQWFDLHDVVWLARAATVVYFAYTVAVLLIVLGTGGSQSSPFASVLLINATFGYSLAEKKSVKRAACWAPVLLYALGLLFHVGAGGLLCVSLTTESMLPSGVYLFVSFLVAVMTNRAFD